MKEVIISFILLTGLVIGAIYGDYVFGNGYGNIHKSLFIFIAYVSINILFKQAYTTNKHVDYILLIVVVIGGISLLFAFLQQRESIINVLKGSNVSYYSWKFVSFFRQRNIFGEYCFLASFASAFLYLRNKKLRYLIMFILFGIAIFVTNSRAALLAYILQIGFYIYLSRRNKYITICFALVLIWGFFYTFGISNFIDKFYHAATGGEDSGIVRLRMWADSFNFIMNHRAYIMGFGAGAIGIYLTPIFNVGSTHNSFMDALFDGGLIYLCITVRSFVMIVKKVRSTKRNDISILWQSAIFSYGIYCLFETGMMVYESNYFSVSSTILLLLLPKLYCNFAGYNE